MLAEKKFLPAIFQPMLVIRAEEGMVVVAQVMLTVVEVRSVTSIPVVVFHLAAPIPHASIIVVHLFQVPAIIVAILTQIVAMVRRAMVQPMVFATLLRTRA